MPEIEINQIKDKFISVLSPLKIYLKKGDARKLDFIPNESIDLACLHPPYADNRLSESLTRINT